MTVVVVTHQKTTVGQITQFLSSPLAKDIPVSI
jgi:hypothetical protein